MKTLYGGVIEKKLNLSDPTIRKEAETVDLEELSDRAAHQFDDMVLDCKWEGKILKNCSNYFSTIISHNGHCYSFNSYDYVEANSRIKTAKSGAHQGLTLTINMEQYEYTRGPHNAAGLIVSTNEVCLVAQVNMFL